MGRNVVGLVLILGGVLGAATAPPGRADEAASEFDRTPQECIRRARLDRTEVVDDRTILFYMYGGAIYRNHLPDTCRGLKPRDPFMLSDRGPSSQSVCANEFIDLLQGFGRSLTRGRSCRLGQFHPITPEEVEELKNLPNRRAFEVTPVPDGVGQETADESDSRAAP